MAHNKKEGFPISHIVGFIASLVLTFATVGAVFYTDLSFKTIMWVIGSLAVIQAGLQLYMFMHMTEGEDGKANVLNIAYALFMAAVIVIGSIWVLSSGHAHY